MNTRHELLGEKWAISVQHKKNKIVADALAAHITNLLSSCQYEAMNTEDLQLSAQSLAEIVGEMKKFSERMQKIDQSLGVA